MKILLVTDIRLDDLIRIVEGVISNNSQVIYSDNPGIFSVEIHDTETNETVTGARAIGELIVLYKEGKIKVSDD